MTFTERIEARGDARFYVSDDGDLYVLREMYEMGEGRSVYLVDIQPGVKVLDIGAHKGIFSIWAAKRGALVTAYEPDPVTFRVFKSNLELNEVSVEARNLGVLSSPGIFSFYSDNQNSGCSTFHPQRVDDLTSVEPRCVEAVSFDDALGGSEWDLVKIDAEGSEYEMILSSNRLGQIKQLTIEWHWRNREVPPELSEITKKLSVFFDIPQIDYDWHILTMRRK